MNEKELIDGLIKVLTRVKNCKQALDNLEHARMNLFFSKPQSYDEKHRLHIKSLIEESIQLIMDDKNQKEEEAKNHANNLSKAEVAIKKLQSLLYLAIKFYKENKDDEDLVCDKSIEQFHCLSRGDCVQILKILSED
jgi:hypothetical protein